MATRWRSRIPLYLYSLLCVIGLSGPLTLIGQGSHYIHRDYYHTPEFRGALDQYVSYLNLFQLNSMDQAEAKAAITVDKNEIEDYRNRNGSLGDQIGSLRAEYEPLIQDAIGADNPEVADYYKAERNRKLEELTKIVKDDTYVSALVKQEKEQRIDRYYRIREDYRADYMRLQNRFDYYLKNDSAGIFRTNLGSSNEESARKTLFSNDYSYALDYAVGNDPSLHPWIEGHELIAADIPYEGWIAVPQDSPIRAEADKYRLEQLILLVYGLAGIALLFGCLYRFRSFAVAKMEPQRWTTYYRKLPIDVKALLFAGTTALTIGLMVRSADQYPYLFDQPWIYGRKTIVAIAIAAGSLALTLIQGRLLKTELLDWGGVKREWQRALLKSASERIKAYLIQVVNQAKDSFIYKSIGIQLLVMALVLFGLGVIGGWTAILFDQYDYFYFFLFASILVIAGLPVIILSMWQIGYLNRVAKAADELAAGRLTTELPVRGRTVLASMAANINVLRRGVRSLQSEQAKSERLKTELIANVSHDLRTPLTSIITYAGLLKSEDATPEERTAYLEIIDRKSKRLKTMIDDLFEVSKMSSGNVELALERADLVQLMQQALAEYRDVLKDSPVQFRVSLPDKPVYALVDGQKLWRAFDNLIGNMVKYSLDHSRAYITLLVPESQEAAIAFKNVSKFEYGDQVEELFERFKRGDSSRHTEGAGLGLAIAKSIVDLHGGSLTIETDGDLFKAVVTLKLAPSSNGS